MHQPPFSQNIPLQKHNILPNHEKTQNLPLQQFINHSPHLLTSLPTTLLQRYMKFRKLSFDQYFIEVSQEMLKLANQQYSINKKQLENNVQVQNNWILFNWIIEFQNLSFIAKHDQIYLESQNHKIQQLQRSDLELDFEYINKFQRIKKSNEILQKLNKSVVFLIINLKSSEFYAVQLLIKLIKLDHFYKNMKSFIVHVSQLLNKYSCFGINKNSMNGYEEQFYRNYQPELKKIKKEILTLYQAYEFESMMEEKKHKMYDLELSIKALRASIYRQQLSLSEKEENLDFVFKNANIQSILSKMNQLRSNGKNTSLIRKQYIKVSDLIRINQQILTKAINTVQNHKSRNAFNYQQNLKITGSLYDINSDNSNSFVETDQNTKKLNEIEKLQFSKSFDLSNTERQIQKIPSAIISCQPQMTFLQMLDDQKTIRHNLQEIRYQDNRKDNKKEKKIKKDKKKTKILSFSYISGKTILTEKQQQTKQVNKFKQNYKEKRLKQLQEKQSRKERQKQRINLQKFEGFSSLESNKLDSTPQNKHSSSFNNKSQMKKIEYSVSKKEENKIIQTQQAYKTPIKIQNRSNFLVGNVSINKKDDNAKVQGQNSQVKDPILIVSKKDQQKNAYDSNSSSFNKFDNFLNKNSIDKTVNFKQSYKLLNRNYAPISRSSLNGNRFNLKSSIVKKNKNSNSSNSRVNLHVNSISHINLFKKNPQPKFDPKNFMSTCEQEEYLVEGTPPKYKKNQIDY